MNFDRDWTAFALEAEAEAFGFGRIAAAHNKLRRALPAEQTGGWRPIESAPEGVSILAYWPVDDEFAPGLIETIKWDSPFYTEMGDMPTHWQPLPAPPVVDDKTEKEGT